MKLLSQLMLVAMLSHSGQVFSQPKISLDAVCHSGCGVAIDRGPIKQLSETAYVDMIGKNMREIQEGFTESLDMECQRLTGNTNARSIAKLLSGEASSSDYCEFFKH